MDTKPTLEGVRRELMFVRKGRGFGPAKFKNAEHLRHLPAVDHEMTQPGAEAGGRTALAMSLVKCVLERHSFSTEAHREILRYTMNLRKFAPNQKSDGLDDRRFWAEKELRESHPTAFRRMTYRTVEEHALEELTDALLHIEKSPCTGASAPPPASAEVREGTRHLLAALMTMQGIDETRRWVEEVLRGLPGLPPEMVAAADPFATLHRLLRAMSATSYQRRVNHVRKAIPAQMLLTPASLRKFLDAWFETRGQLDRYALTDVSFARGSRVHKVAEFSPARGHALRRVGLDSALGASLELLADEMSQISEESQWHALLAAKAGRN